MKKYVLSILFTVAFSVFAVYGAVRPRLVVNVIATGVRYDDIKKYSEELSDGGLGVFLTRGLCYTEARYDYMQTFTEAGLATFTTGCNPSMHGVVSSRWTDYTTSKQIQFADDKDVRGIGCDVGQGCYSPKNIIVPTLGDKLKSENEKSQVVSVAVSPSSAVALGGKSDTYWFNTTDGSWNSSTAYIDKAPTWLPVYNRAGLAATFRRTDWTLSKTAYFYHNTLYSTDTFVPNAGWKRVSAPSAAAQTKDFRSFTNTPFVNTVTFDFAKQLVADYSLGEDDNTDVLNICLDGMLNIARVYGTESLEWEDALYRMNNDLSDFMNFVNAQVNSDKVLWVFTSADGVSPTVAPDANRFNASQFKVVMNAFLSTQFGRGNWVLDYADRQLYLNRDVIYASDHNLTEIQNRAASFALQFRGVAQVLSATAMQSTYFGSSYGHKMQNSFYPRRSGDLIINLMPGWIEDCDYRASSGSLYDYDTHVPLMIMGCGLEHAVIKRTTDMCSVAPSVARIMGIGRPIVSEATVLDEFENLEESK